MDNYSSKHAIFLILGTAIISLKTYPTIITKESGNDSWIAVIVASIFFIAYFMYIIKTCKNNNCFNIYTIYTNTCGKFIGKSLLYLLILNLFLTCVECSSIESNSMHTNMLLETPTWFFVLFFVLPALYTILKGSKTIITVTLIGITLIIFAGTNLFILMLKYKKIELLFPIFKDGITTGFLHSIIKSIGLYSSVFIVLPYLNYINDTSKIKKNILYSLFFIIQMEIVSITGAISTFGIQRVNNMSYPKILQTQLISYFRFLESGEFFVMLQIVGGWYIKYIISFYSISLLLKQFNYSNKYFAYFLSVFIFIFTIFISDNLLLLFRCLNLYSYICFFNYFLIPITVFIIYDIKNKANKK